VRLLRFVARLAGAAIIGVATLFVPKAEPQQHWSVPPTFPVEHDDAGLAAGGRR
jgi:hypothetical protein